MAFTQDGSKPKYNITFYFYLLVVVSKWRSAEPSRLLSTDGMADKATQDHNGDLGVVLFTVA